MDSSTEVFGPNLQSSSVRAVAYFRCSVQNQQENSIALQQNQVRQWAHERGIEIIKEFCDIGPADADSSQRPAFTEMLDAWIKPRSNFGYILCFDASRLGRFPFSDSSATPVEMVHQNKKQLIFTSMGKPQTR
jgi:DNA invertase Pin-like site-specific DNA recombinase